jgi:hypothetical protein
MGLGLTVRYSAMGLGLTIPLLEAVVIRLEDGVQKVPTVRLGLWLTLQYSDSAVGVVVNATVQ